MAEEETIIIDLAAKSEEALHAQISHQLHFPNYYGANLDALDECLSEISQPVHVRIINRNSATIDADRVSKFLLCFEDAMKTNDNLKIEVL